MPQLANRQWIYRQRPEDRLAAHHFAWQPDGRCADPAPGEVLVRVQMLSVDPSQRAWMAGPSYRPMLQPGGVMASYGVGVVVASRAPGIAAGDRVEGDLGWQDHAVAPAQALRVRDATPPIEQVVGVLGITGVTAYIGLFDIGRPLPGETVLVSGAAGAVGSIALQLAKRAGCRVVGIAGGRAKCDYVVDSLGFDACIDRKLDAWEQALEAACPKGVDVDFENVGGAVLDAVLRLMNTASRVVLCGLIAEYSASAPSVHNLRPVLVKRIRMQGMIVFDWKHRYAEAVDALRAHLHAGRIHYRESIVEGLDNAPRGLIALLNGDNFGKQVVRLV